MKELTIEEKAKAYDNLLERLKEMYNDNKTNIVSRLTYERYFPELKNKESEDEKIRKHLITHFRHKAKQEWNGMPVKNIIAWLEKQSEIVVLDEQIWKIAYNSAKTWEQSFAILQATQTAYNKGKKDALKEQEPVSITDEWIEDYWQHKKVNNPYSYDKGEEIQFDHQGFVRFCKKYCKKPAEWTKEDEVMLDAIISNYEFLSERWLCEHEKELGVPADGARKDNAEEIDWLKSFKDRVQPQSKQDEQKHQEDDDIELTDFEADLFSAFSDGWQIYLHDKDGLDVAQWAKEHSSELLESAKRTLSKWSDEDAEILSMLIELVESKEESMEAKVELVAWLKSLKGRVQSQPKQEWSEEDSKRLQRIIDFLWHNRKGDTDTIYQQEQDIEWLKSLKQRIGG